MDERQSVEDRPSSFTAKGLFDLSFENEGANRSSVSDIWNLPSDGNAKGIISQKTSGSRWFPSREHMMEEQPSPALIRTRQGSHALQRKSGIGDKLRKTREVISALDEVTASNVGQSPSKPARLSMGVVSYTPGSLLKGSITHQSGNRSFNYDKLSHTPRVELGFTTPKASLSIMESSGATRELMLEKTPMHNQATLLDQSYEADTNLKFMDLRTPSDSKLLEDPIEKTGRDLVFAFHESFSSYRKPGDVLEFVESLQNACQSQVDELDDMAEMTKLRDDCCAQLRVDLNLERSTWELVHALYTDRMETEQLEEEEWDRELMITDLFSTDQSDKAIVDDFFAKDSSVRQAQLVVDWLEKNAKSNLKRYPEKINYFADVVTWENTLHSLQHGRNDGSMVTEMDPDAPARQGRNLVNMDARDEQSLIKHLFACVRAGEFVMAQELCVKCGQPWRAASLEGWKLSHDPNLGKNLVNDEIEAIEGNQTRDLWKLACWEMARDPDFDKYEKALYAAQAGDLKNILPVCSGWHDYVWAYFRVMVDVLTEKRLRAHSPTTGQSLEKMPPEYFNSILIPEVIFQEIEACPIGVIRNECKNCFHLTHKFLILGDMENLILTIHSWLRHSPNINQLRFMAHLVLFVKGLGLIIEEEKCNEIMEAFVKELTGKEYYTTVALYAAQLPAHLQISCYADLLRGISDPEQQRMCLDLGKRVGLDIAAITKSVVEHIRNIGMDTTVESVMLGTSSEVEITEVDESKIEVIKWLVFEEAQREEAIIQGNALMRQFLASRKLTAAHAVFSKLPSDSIEVIMKNWQSENGDQPLPLNLTNAIREYHCIQAYLDANDCFNLWFEHYHQMKPEPPSEPLHADFRGKVEYEQRLKQYKLEESNWESHLNFLSEDTEAKLYNLLMFVQGGWMVDIPGAESIGSADDHRTKQMRVLRESCIPQACILLHTVFHSTNQFNKCLGLADVVASERYKLYQLFRQHELEKFLSLIQKSACCIVDDRTGNLGYPI